MSHDEEISAAIDRARKSVEQGLPPAGNVYHDRALLAEEVVRLRERVGDLEGGYGRYRRGATVNRD